MIDGHDIDKLFLTEGHVSEEDSLNMIEKYLLDSKPLVNSLSNLEDDINARLKIFELYKLKLESLSKEIVGIEIKNDDTKREIRNQENVYEALKTLLVSVEIKEEHFIALKHPNYENLGTIQIALSVLKDFDCEYDIKIVNERNIKINETLKTFLKNFVKYFERRLNLIQSESTGELKIHTKVYEEVKRYEFIIDFCKDTSKENFIIISKKYLLFQKKLYESEFENHLNLILKAIKSCRNNLKEKLEDLFSVIFESFTAILKCETNFIKRIFFDKSEFVNDFINNMFYDVLNIFLDFLGDCRKINNILTMNALYKVKDMSGDFGDGNINFVEKIKENLSIILLDSENEYLKSLGEKWKTLSKRKLLSQVLNDIKINSNVNMSKRALDFLVSEIEKIKQGSKGKIGFCIYRLKMLYDIKKLPPSINSKKTNVLDLMIQKNLEKEVITYVLSEEDKKIPKKIKNIRDLINETDSEDLNFQNVIIDIIKKALFDNISEDQREIVAGAFNKYN